jgi:hypothetical protein
MPIVVSIRFILLTLAGENQVALENAALRQQLQSQKLCRISAALRHDANGDSDSVGLSVVRNEHRGRDARLFSVAIQFPKLDVAGRSPSPAFYFE